MKKFEFKLAPVLKQRKLKEEEALRNLGVAQRAYQAELERKRVMLESLQSSLQRRERLGQEAIGVLAFQLENEFIAGTKQRIQRQDQAIFRASKGVEKALRAYLQAKKSLRALETLHDKAYAEYRNERARREQREQDDLVLMRARLGAGDL